MFIRIALFAAPIASVAVLVPTLKALDAGAGIVVAALGLVVVASGAALGVFADRLPELPWTRGSGDPTRLAGTRHGRH
jgi:hypothetical protein